MATDRVVEKYPEAIYRVPFVQAIFPDAKFILLVLNGLDVVRSVGSWSETHPRMAAVMDSLLVGQRQADVETAD